MKTFAQASALALTLIADAWARALTVTALLVRNELNGSRLVALKLTTTLLSRSLPAHLARLTVGVVEKVTCERLEASSCLARVT